MDKLLRNFVGQFKAWRILLFVLASMCEFSETICAAAVWGRLTPQDTADINALLPRLANPGQDLWVAVRANSPVINPTEILREHYDRGHGVGGSDTRTLPNFNGARVFAVVGPNPATAEEVVMARFINSLVPPGGGAPVVPAGAQVQTKSGGSREVRIPVPAGQVKVTPKGRRGVSVDAHYCSIILPAVPPGVAPPGAAAVLAPPANVCTLFFK